MSRPKPATLVRIALALFVAAWIFGPYSLRAAVPLWLPFLVALALELQFLLGALRPAPVRRPDRGPSAADRERYGYVEEDERDEDEEPLDEEQPPDEEQPLEQPLDDEPEPYAEPRDPLRAFGRFAAGVAVIAALAVGAWAVDSRSGWDGLDEAERAQAAARFSDEASRIAGKPVRIECDETGDHVGVVQHADGAAVVGGDTAYLTPERCLDLYRAAFDGEVRGSRTGRAIAVLAHEAWHLRGVRDEGVTECYALQSGVALGRRLGLSEETSRRLMRRQLVENANRGPGSFEYRVPAECRDGGRLDLAPGDARFP